MPKRGADGLAYDDSIAGVAAECGGPHRVQEPELALQVFAGLEAAARQDHRSPGADDTITGLDARNSAVIVHETASRHSEPYGNLRAAADIFEHQLEQARAGGRAAD